MKMNRWLRGVFVAMLLICLGAGPIFADADVPADLTGPEGQTEETLISGSEEEMEGEENISGEEVIAEGEEGAGETGEASEEISEDAAPEGTDPEGTEDAEDVVSTSSQTDADADVNPAEPAPEEEVAPEEALEAASPEMAGPSDGVHFNLETNLLSYYKDGVIDTTFTGVAQNSEDGKWYYFEKGVQNSSYTGFAKNASGVWWYVEAGEVSFTTTGMYQDTNGTVTADKAAWWYVSKSKVLAHLTNKKNEGAAGWNMLDPDGKVYTGYTGFAQNKLGWWYAENGKITFTKEDLIKDTKGVVSAAKKYWNVKKSAIKKGISVAKNAKGYWYVGADGSVDFTYNGLASNEKGTWYLEKGKVNFKKTDVVKAYLTKTDADGNVVKEGGWWNIVKGKLVKGPAVGKNSKGWWYVGKDGKVDFTYTGFVYQKNNTSWYYAEKGKISLKKTDVIKGKINKETAWYYVKNSKVQFVNTFASNSKGTWRIRDGKVDFTFTGISSDGKDMWYVKKGKVQTSFNGKVIVNGKTYKVKNGKATKADTTQDKMEEKAQGYTSPTSYLILVNRNSTRVCIYKRLNGRWVEHKSFGCCVGAKGSPTITGIYHMGSKGLYFNTGSGGRCWYYSQIKGNYLFHSQIYDRQSSPRRVIDAAMNKWCSHGCVRLLLSDAKYIYDNIPKSTTIVIY